jgi:SAM-dependent methyltransferase
MTFLAPRPSSPFIQADADAQAAGALAEQAFEAVLGALELGGIYLGDRLGLYAALAERGPATAGELAARTATDQRYVREWLEQQAAAGVLACDDAAAAPEDRRFSLSAGHADALLNPDSLATVPGMVRLAIGSLAILPRLLDAFVTGDGIPYADYGADVREGIADGNRPLFSQLLGTEWLPAVPEVHARLRSAPARVADLACGCGWSSLSIARAYPLAHVDGLDEDAASVGQARRNAADAGLDGRVRFFCQDASDDALTGTYDLVTIFEALHDMARPVEALRAARALLAKGGSVLVADERAGEHFTAPAEDPLDRLFYGFSVLHCLPVGRVDQPSAATGTVMRPHTLREYADAAGFSRAEVLPIEHDVWRFYRLIP